MILYRMRLLPVLLLLTIAYCCVYASSQEEEEEAALAGYCYQLLYTLSLTSIISVNIYLNLKFQF